MCRQIRLCELRVAILFGTDACVGITTWLYSPRGCISEFKSAPEYSPGFMPFSRIDMVLISSTTRCAYISSPRPPLIHPGVQKRVGLGGHGDKDSSFSLTYLMITCRAYTNDPMPTHALMPSCPLPHALMPPTACPHTYALMPSCLHAHHAPMPSCPRMPNK